MGMTSEAAKVVLKVGVTGHRKLGSDPGVSWFVTAECVRILDRLRALGELRRVPILAYSALAIGADQLFAQAAVGLGIPLVGVVPFDDYPADFEEGEREVYDALLVRCREVYRLPIKRRSNKAYMEAGKWLVNQSDYVVAIWDGQPAAGLGGTGDVVAYAERKGRTVFRIDPSAAPHSGRTDVEIVPRN
jgi:hypothetical protein